MPSTGQVENFLARANGTANLDGRLYGPDDKPLPPAKKATVAFPSAYVLTHDQEADLIDHIFERKDTLERELGRDVLGRGDDYWFVGAGAGLDKDKGVESLGFLPRRALFDLIYLNKMGWRRWCIGRLFAKSNISLPLTRRVVRQMVAKANAFFFGSDPWFGLYAATTLQKALADAIDRFGKYKVRGSKLVQTLRKAVRLAFIRGEGIVKSTYEVREQVYKTRAKILVNAVDDEPILDARGDYIFEQDAWTAQLAKDTITGATVPTGLEVLRKDSATVRQGVNVTPATTPGVPVGAVFVEKIVTRVIPLYRGPRSEVVYTRDILIPLQAASVHTADIVIHLYDKPVMEVADLMRRANALGGGQDAADLLASQEQNAEGIRRAVDAISDMSGGGDQPKSAASQPRTELGEQTSGNSSGTRNPSVEWGECYLTYDADGDGIAEEIVVHVDVKNRRPIYYDYLANVFNNARRPYEVLRIHEIDDRWYGLGAVEMFDGLQSDLDLQINRANLAQSESGRVTFWNPSLTKEGQSNPHLVLNHGKTYTKLKEGIKAEDILEYVTLPDVKAEEIMKRIEYDVQFVTTESGVASANDGAMAGLDSQKLATGINNNERSGNEMFSEFTNTLEGEISQVLENEINLIFSRLDPIEGYDFFDGQNGARVIAELNADDVRHLAMKVDLTVTRTQGQQEVQNAMQFITLAAGKKSFFELDPEVQTRLAPIFTTIGKALKIPEADEVFQPLTGAPPANGSPTPTGSAPALPAPAVTKPSVPVPTLPAPAAPSPATAGASTNPNDGP